MANAVDKSTVTFHADPAFGQAWHEGKQPHLSGIYRCDHCSEEEVHVMGKTLPPCSTCGSGRTTTWLLIVTPEHRSRAQRVLTNLPGSFVEYGDPMPGGKPFIVR